MRNNIINIISIILVLSALVLTNVSQVLAHVTVKPAEVGAGQRVNFSVSVPTEEGVPTVQLRLIIPEDLESVRPNVKPGWTIELKKSGEGEDAKVTEIIWSGGSIPAELRDEFIFSAQAPAEETDLAWKAYQTYENGDIVAWENSPEVVKEHEKNNPSKEGEEDHNSPRPYSETKVVNDLKETAAEKSKENAGDKQMVFSIAALLFSIVAVVIASRKK